MAYVGSVNNVVTLGTADYFNAIKTALLAAGWELLASSDATNYTAGSSPDRLPDAASWNNSGSWCRLREPGGAGGREYCFMRGSVNTTAIIKYSRATGFIGGSPNATTLPTTGAGGDGVVWLANTNIGFGNEASVTSAASGGNFATASGYVSCVASNTALNGVYGWWMARWAAGGTPGELLFTEAVQAGTYPSQDLDPSYRLYSGTADFFASNKSAPTTPQYWQAYDFSAPISPYRSYVIGGFGGAGTGFGIPYAISSGLNVTSQMVPRTNIGLGPYGVGAQTYPLLIGTGFQANYPKGMSTGIVFYNLTLNNCDTFNLTGSEPKVVIQATYGFAMPWIPSTVPVY